MKLLKMIPLTLLCIALTGCILVGPLVQQGELTVVRLAVHSLRAPTINGMPYGYLSELVPGNRYKLNWRTGVDQYGNPTGLSDDRVCTMFDVIIQLPERAVEETVFWPTIHGRASPPNLAHWFPGHIPGPDLDGRPTPPMFVAGYSFDALCGVNLGDPMHAQTGSLIGIGRVNVASVGITCPTYTEPGAYMMNIPGEIPQESGVYVYNFSEPGTYEIVWEADDSDATAIHEFEIPVDWFWLRGEWPISVGPTGTCGPLRVAM